MNTFIDEVIDDLLKKDLDFSSLKIILPSRRAGTFFKKRFAQKLGEASSFLPICLSIEELISDMAGLELAGQTHLQLELYNVYKAEATINNQDSFIDFLGWCQTLLSDFNEIDRYLVDPENFFGYLTALKRLEEWNVNPQEDTLASNYIQFWQAASKIYYSFISHLEQQKIGYQGLLYRRAAEHCEEYIKKDNSLYIFAGFNALNKAEQHIIKKYLTASKSLIYWDIDPYFLDKKESNITLFIQEYKKKWPHQDRHYYFSKKSKFNTQKEIYTYGISQSIGQVKYIGQLLSHLSQEQLENTAVVLGDENLLLPLLNSLPQNVDKVNVTMGLPLSQIPDAAFFENLFSLHKNQKNNAFYYKDLLALLAQSQSKNLLGSKATLLQHKIKSENLIYISTDKIFDIIGHTENSEVFFTSWEDAAGKAIQACITIIAYSTTYLTKHKRYLQLTYIKAFQELFYQLENLIHTYEYINDIKTLHRFYKELLAQETLDLRGDPYTGLQIMGVLESRTIDFETVIISSLNEGTLPSGKSQNSFIPFELKLDYNLPTYREKDAIYAYHFFRLLQRPQHCHLLYNNQADGLNPGEKSRFLLQLETDFEAQYILKQSSVAAPVTIQKQELKSIYKSPEVLQKLKRLAAYGFSPSALTTYIRNPIDFYYRYVLDIKELDEVEDTVAYNTLGTVVHNTLENLYKPYENEQLSVDILKALTQKIDKEVEKQFDQEYNLTHTKTGKNLIIFKVAQQFVKNFIQKEIQELTKGADIVLKQLEQKNEAILDMNIKLRGTVDREDVYNGNTRIIDYKTGKVEQTELNVKDWELLTTDYKKHAKAFQLLCYALIYQKNTPTFTSTEAAIVSFKNLKSSPLLLKIENDKEITSEILSAFEKQLMLLIKEILDPQKPFLEKEV